MEKRNITKEDIFIKARLLAEGVRMEIKKAPVGHIGLLRPIILDGCGLKVHICENPYSRLKLIVEGERVSILDEGTTLAGGVLEARPSWLDLRLSNGQSIEVALPSMSATIFNIIFHYSCHNCNIGQGCRYCAFFSSPMSQQMADLPRDTLSEIALLYAETVKLATDHGWRGTLALTGGALPPSRRKELPELMDLFLSPIRKAISPEVFADLHVVANVYPPDNFSDMHAWKELGINATEFDLEVMDPAYFAALCPGKNSCYPLQYWKEAQVASTEIFGPGRGTVSFVLMGLEPMECLVEGMEERLSKGVFPSPLNYIPLAGSQYERFRSPTADWLVEANEKMADSCYRHRDKLGVDLLQDHRPGYTQIGKSFHIMILPDEIMRRAQESGALLPIGAETAERSVSERLSSTMRTINSTMVTLDEMVAKRARHATDILSGITNVKATYLFGAHAEGRANMFSTVDLAVFVDGLDAWEMLDQVETSKRINKDVGSDLKIYYLQAQELHESESSSFSSRIINQGILI